MNLEAPAGPWLPLVREFKKEDMFRDRQYRRAPRVVVGMLLGMLLGVAISPATGSNLREGFWTPEMRSLVGVVLGFVAGWVWANEMNRR